ncbi:hypothetical protein BDY17DRAFT_327829 [Neohortaea acidophila]|uniref:Uncharacterized protein n=1 Tax=Neohortaea acidophila TaxID=245834 RepID=A0A6A6PGC0_9PEZI|nr:uncharacterized protein BDY17DRAFT_327829 [Neohortaea acidophila]KAF2479028.1 hypothetical protein BDY17DRAFT_327829 [Neohortaea acidophila]
MLSKIILTTSLAVGALAAKSASSGSAAAGGAAATKVKLFLGPKVGKNVPWQGSVVSVSDDTTVVALTCTQSPQCVPAATATITNGPSYFAVSTSTTISGALETLLETCDLHGASTAVCTQSLYYADSSTSTSSVTSRTFTGGELAYQQIPITAGASLISAGGSGGGSGGHGGGSGHGGHTSTPSYGSGSSAATGSSAASPSGSATGTLPGASSTLSTAGSSGTSTGGAAPTTVRDIYKVLIVPGAAALLAAGALL